MNRLLILIALACVVCQAAVIPSELASKWEAFKSQYAKVYSSSAEEMRRRRNFEASLQFVEEHNALYAQGLTSFEVGINRMSDMDDEEYKQTMLMSDEVAQRFIEERQSGNGIPFSSLPKTVAAAPASIDWREKGAVTKVKDQGTCGSCYCFAAVGALESQGKIVTGANLLEISEQEALDCSGTIGNLGCNGGWTTKVYQYVINNKRITKSSAYPYEKKLGTCRAKTDSASFGASVASYIQTKLKDENDMKEALGTKGPIAISLDASATTFKSFRGTGVYDEKKACKNNWTNHAMLAVGYGTTTDGKDYWLVKNSWGTSWGDQGYIKIARGNFTCAIGYWGADYPNVSRYGA